IFIFYSFYFNMAKYFDYSGLIVFFFQAEDGIRDFHVTGVQTCALPIFSKPLALSAANRGLAASALLKYPTRNLYISPSLMTSRSSIALNRASILGLEEAEIGRTSCRERGEVRGVGVAITHKKAEIRDDT